MNDWIACLIGFVIGIVLASSGISLWNFCHGFIRRTNGPIITHKCNVCGENYWTRGK